MARVSTYLNFTNQTEQAFNFYKSVFGTEFEGDGINRFGDMPPQEGAPPMNEATKKLVLHVSLPITGGYLLMGSDAPEEMEIDKVSTLYDKYVQIAKHLMMDKNHDYGEAWRSMSQESFVDLILMKLQRIRQILNNDGKTIMSEGIDANYHDIINYAAFALILM